MDYSEIIHEIQAILTEAGYGWVVREVADELETGKLIEEKLPTLADYELDGLVSPLAREFKKGVPGQFVRRVDYTERESVALLLEATQRAIPESSLMCADVVDYFSRDGIVSIRLVRDERKKIYLRHAKILK